MFFDKKKSYKRIDYFFIATVVLLVAFGLIIVSSATLSYAPAKRAGYMKTQIFSTLLGFVAMFVLMYTPPSFFKKLAIPIYIISNLLLVATLIFATSFNSAKSWLEIHGVIKFQPAEVVKIGIIISLAAFLDKNKYKINEPLTLLKLLLLAFLPVALILKQPDMGTAFVYLCIIAVMFFIAGLNLKYVFLALGMVIVYIPVFWFNLSDYARDRIFDFLEPERDISGSGMQAYIGKISLGSGKFFGRGLYKGLQNQNNYILLKHSDFIFPVIGEELGLRGGIILFALYILLLYRMIRIARNSSFYERVLISGISAMFMVHIWENIAMTMTLMPVTGIPLPFISHGGTFQLANLISIGLVLGIKYHEDIYNMSKGKQINNMLKSKEEI